MELALTSGFMSISVKQRRTLAVSSGPETSKHLIFSGQTETTIYTVNLEFAENVFGTFFIQILVALTAMEAILYALIGMLIRLKIFNASLSHRSTEYIVVSICPENIKYYLVFGPLETAGVRRSFTKIDMKLEVKASSILELFYPQVYLFVRAMHDQRCMCGQFVYNYDMFRCPREKSIGGAWRNDFRKMTVFGG
ncbi:hypothetical protein YC2023_090081 [Brassica napus]